MASFSYADRLDRAQREMAREGIDLLVVGASADLRYLIGFAGHESERLSVLVLPRDGAPHYVAPGLEAPLLHAQRDLLEIVPWEETEDPVAKVAAVAGPATLGTIAAGDELWSVFTIRLQQAMPRARWAEGGQLLRPLRMIKDAREIALLAEAARRTDDSWEEFLTTSITGLTEWQVRERLLALLAERGLDPVFCNVGSGPNGASPHQTASDRVVGPGDAVVCDWGGTLEGYNSDVTRTAHGGEPSPAFVRAYDAVAAANQAAFEAVRPGTACQEIDRAARGVLAAAGYGDAFIHRTGHGLGLSLHEEPYLVEGNTLPLEEGMVFSDEPGVYFPGEFGIRIEDTVVCTADGGRRLNEATRELRVMG
ncbi:MAG: aminopeptidase P family protein [Chloroflexia bacterium]|nr:aminopeptidase P family protein [Chloroflexia bacterium]